MTNNEQGMTNDEGWNRFALSFSIKLAAPTASGWVEPWTSKHMLYSQSANIDGFVESLKFDFCSL
jgi:hypothetical protein